ncbi:hypothetical protein [Streptomyces sp. NPDC089919]|uniref:hypothetical protein n=1 Tax=Streptomyces sp. NPDC089919 TaxID=3155188 RepID=UPI00344A6867
MTWVAELARLGSTGALGVLAPGAGLAGISAALGEPVDLGPVSGKRGWPRRFGAGSVEMVFCPCRSLRSLTLSLVRDPVVLPGPGRGQERRFGGEVTEPALVSALRAEGCRWQVVEYEFAQRDLALKPAEGVHVSFAFTHGAASAAPRPEEWVLDKAGFWTSGHGPCADGGAGDRTPAPGH